MKKKRSILISTYGSRTAGMGHIIRVLTLFQKLKKDYIVLFHVSEINSETHRLFSLYGVKQIYYNPLQQLLKKIHAQLLIYDRPYNDGILEPLPLDVSIVVIGLDYFFYKDNRIACAINLVNHYFPRDGTVVYGALHEGYQYVMIRDEIKRHQKKQSQFFDKVKHIVITFGGGDPNGHTEKIIHVLELIHTHRMDITVVVGPYHKKTLQEFVHPLKGGFHRYKFYSTTKDLGKLMAKADIAISGGGMTMAELLYLGVPSFIVPQNIQEERFAKQFMEHGACIILSSRRKFMSTWRNIIKHLFDDAITRRKMAFKAQSMIDGRGVERVAKIVRSYLI